MGAVTETSGKMNSQKDLFKVMEAVKGRAKFRQKHGLSQLSQPVHTPGGYPTSASPFPSPFAVRRDLFPR